MGSLKETYNKSVQCFFSQKSLHPIVEDAGLKKNVISFFLKRIPFLVLVFHACCYDILWKTDKDIFCTWFIKSHKKSWLRKKPKYTVGTLKNLTFFQSFIQLL